MTLFKYVVPERIDVLESGLIRFTHPSALNDPLDIRPTFDTLISDPEASTALRERLDPRSIADKAYAELPADLRSTMTIEEFRTFADQKVASPEGQQTITTVARLGLAIMNSFAPRLRTEIYETLDRSVGVLSLSEVWDNQPMWAHYADQHRGFVIELDPNSPFFSRRRTAVDECYHLRRVIYSDSPNPQTLSQLGDESIFLRKAASWSYEREWRMLVPLSDADRIVGSTVDPVHLFQLPDGAITSIIVGRHTSGDLLSALLAAKASRSSLTHVRLARAELDFATGKMAIHSL